MEDSSDSVISCQGITKLFGSGDTAVEALRGVDLSMKLGELLMIVGPSGSGKTTLISVIAGILEASEGLCSVFGHELGEMDNGELTHFRGKEIGFVFQAFNLIPMLTAVENVTVPLLLNGAGQEEAETRAREILCRFGLEEKLDAYPPDLSGGQQQRVAIARSAVHNPRLIVCDEPTSSLDHETGTQVMELLKQEVHEKNRALIIVTHDPRIFDYADRIVTLEDGKIQ